MIDFDLNDDQSLIRETLAQFVSRTYSFEQRRGYRAQPAGFSRQNWSLLAELGLLALPLKAEAGGLGGSLADLALVQEEMGKGLTTEPYLSSCLATDLIATMGSADQKNYWLPLIGQGQRLVTAAHAALPDGPDAPDIRAETDEGGYRLSGRVGFVEAAAGADALLLPANLASVGTAIFIVEAGADGLERRDYRIADGSIAAEIVLDRVRVGEPARMAGDSALAQVSVARASVLASAELVGLMTFLFDATLEYVKTRRQFHRPIGHFQVIQHRMARLYLKLEQSRSLLYKAALMPQSPPDAFIRAAAGTKAYVSEASTHLAHECIQFHGGMGITDELAIGQGHKRIMVLARLFGGPGHQLERYAGQR